MDKPVISTVLCIFSVLFCICDGMSEERGLVTASYSEYYYDQLFHIKKFPGIEDVSDVTPKGIYLQNGLDLYSVDVDYESRTVYTYDAYTRGIIVLSGYNKDLNTTGMALGLLHSGISFGSVQLAVDWLSKTIYWCDSVFKLIAMAPTSADKIDKKIHKLIVKDHVDPAGLAVDPMKQYLFWTDSGKYQKIERSGLLGEDRTTIVSSEHVSLPSHIDVDSSNSRIYWIQRGYILMSATYDGEDVLKIKAFDFFENLFFDLAVFRNAVYLTDIDSDIIHTINKNSGEKMADDVSVSTYDFWGIAVYSEEIQPKRDTDYCAQKNCDQLCVSNPTGATCTCSEGYEYNSTAGECQEVKAGLHTGIVFASRTHICLVDIRVFTLLRFTPECIFTVSLTNNDSAPEGDMIKLFDLNMKDRTTYYVNKANKIYARLLELPIDNDATELLHTVTENVTGLAFDAEGNGNLYLCDDTGKFYSIDVNNKQVTKVETGVITLTQPGNLLVLQSLRKLAFVSGETGKVAIQTMNMDGSGIAWVVDGYEEIQSLTVDQESQIFYFLVARERTIYSVPVDGSKKATEIYVFASSDSYILLHYNKYLAWTYPYSTSYPHLFRTFNIDSGRSLGSTYFDKETTIIDIKVLDEKLQTPDRANPCAVENGGCAYACITKYVNGVMQKTCECGFGYTLDSDNINCISEVVYNNFIVATDFELGQLLQFDLVTGKVHAVPVETRLLIAGVFYDVERKKIIWTEFDDSSVYMANLNGTDRESLSKIYKEDATATYAYRFAKDRTTGNIYYTQPTSSHIGIITPSGENVWLVEGTFSDFRGIAVHPGKSWLYWTDVNTADVGSYIYRANMDGTNKIILMEGAHVQEPDGLAIDYINDQLYWCDRTLDTIQRCNLDGKECETIVNSTTSREKITDIEMDGEFLYYTSAEKSLLLRIDLAAHNTTRTQIGYHSAIGNLDSIILYESANKNVQPTAAACESNGGLGDCSTICLPTPTGRTCACKHGVKLKPDQRFCEDIIQCDITIPIPNSALEEEIKFAKTCDRLLGEKCDYRCPKGYVPTNSSNITLNCTENGWDRKNNLCEEILCPISIKNGALNNTCKRKVGEVCDFMCNPSFTKTEANTFCTTNGTWHKDNDTYCALIQCDITIPIPNSALEEEIVFAKTCDRLVGEKCDYRCPKGYVPTNSNITLTCTENRWDRENNLCEELLCPSSIKNGALNNTCKRKTGEVCDFTCNPSFTKTEVNTFCTTNGTWHKDSDTYCAPFQCSDSFIQYTTTTPIEQIKVSLVAPCLRQINERCDYECLANYKPTDNANTKLTCNSSGWDRVSEQLCEKILCPLEIGNGTFANCQPEVGKTCTFSCKSGFKKTEEKTFCTVGGKWHKSPNAFCTEDFGEASTPAPKVGDDTLPKTATIIGIVICVLVIAILAAALAFIACRKMRNAKKPPNVGRASYHKRRGLPDKEEVDISRRDSSSVRSSYIQPRFNPARDPGLVNPMYSYNNEPLPAVSQVSVRDHNAVSYNAWWNSLGYR